MSDKVVLKYTPANPGDHLRAVPQRDLTEADMQYIEPSQLRNMTVPGPSGKAMYTPVEEKEEPPKTEKPKRESAKAKKEREAAEKAAAEQAEADAKAAAANEQNAAQEGAEEA